MSSSSPPPTGPEGFQLSSGSAVAARQSRALSRGSSWVSSHTDPEWPANLPFPTDAGPPPPTPSPPAPPDAESAPAIHIISENGLNVLASKIIRSTDPVNAFDQWLHSESEVYPTSNDEYGSDSLDENFYESFNPNLTANIDISNPTEEDDLNIGRDEHFRVTSTPIPTPPPSPEVWMNQDDVLECAYKNHDYDFCTTPTRPSDEFHPQLTMHEAEAPTIYAETPVQVKLCPPFFKIFIGKMIRSGTHVITRKHKY